MTTKTHETDPIEKLYNVVKEEGLYTKSIDEFRAKYKTPDQIDNMFNVVREEGLYTKSKEDFYSQYFPQPSKKKLVQSYSKNPLQKPLLLQRLMVKLFHWPMSMVKLVVGYLK